MNYQFYTRLAKYYDRIYHYVDYRGQTEFFLHLIEQFNKSGNNNILDIACGTGTHADLLQKKGFDVTGIDLSSDMLDQAKKKNEFVEFIEGDMKTMKPKKQYGVVLCFFNSMLYNTNREEMVNTLINVYSCLHKGGILVFDTVDKSIGEEDSDEEYSYSDDNLDIIFKPHWVYKKNIMKLEIDFTLNLEVMHDTHLMGAFSLKELEEIAEQVGFEVMVLNRNFDRIEAAEGKHAIFVCKKGE